MPNEKSLKKKFQIMLNQHLYTELFELLFFYLKKHGMFVWSIFRHPVTVKLILNHPLTVDKHF